MKKKPILRLLAGIVLTLALPGCGKHREPPAAETLPVADVKVVAVAPGTLTAQEEVVGTVTAQLRAVIEAKVSGRIQQMRAGVGQTVKAGEPLAELDAEEITARLDQAAALLSQANSDLQRFQTLLAQEAVTQAEFDAVQARQRVAAAAVKETQTMLGYTRIVAPFDGVIRRKQADLGDLASPGRPLFEIEAPGRLQFEAAVPEALLDRLALGDRSFVRVAGVEQPLEGIVTEIAPGADPNSRTFLVKYSLPTAPSLRSGQFGRVAISTGETSALRVPARAVITRGQLELVYVAVDNRAQLRLVKTGKRVNDEVELLSGVEAGEPVIVEGPPRLVDGQPVRINP